MSRGALARVPGGWWPWLLPLAALALWLSVHRELPWVLWGGDEMEYTDLARRLARGDGFTSGVIYPAELGYGAGRDHPSLVRAPLWPLFLAGVFRVLGPHDWAVHVALGILYCAGVGVAAALGTALAGPVAGALAGVAAATSPTTLALSLVGGTEILYALLALALFLGIARGARPVWLGVVASLAYLTRYNGAVLLGAAFLWLLLVPPGVEGDAAPRDVWRARLRSLLECTAGFALVALPWWIRNLALTGDPFFSYYRWAIYFSPGTRSYTTTLLHMLEPDPGAPTAMHPLEKARMLLPTFFLRWPFLAANAAACVGVAVAAVRRDRIAWVFAALAVATTVGLAFALPRGRYFAPLFPALAALGVAAWWRHGGRLRGVGVALVLAAPLLPAFPPEAADLVVLRELVLQPRSFEPDPPWAACIAPDDLIVAEDASRVAWTTDATTIWLPASRRDFWRVVEAHPVDWVFVRQRRELLDARFAAHFTPHPTCGPGLYRRDGS